MRKFALALVALLLLAPQAHAQKTKAAMTTEINTNLPDNTTGLITPAVVRSTLIDMVNSWYGLVDATNAGTGASTFAQINQTGATSGTITLQTQAAAGTWNWNWPTTAGTAGQVLLSQGGGSTAMTWGSAQGFYFDKGGTAQTGMTNGVYSRVTWNTTKFNTTTNALGTNTWTAPAAGLIYMNVTVWCSLNCLNTPNTGNPTFVVKIIKNSGGICNGTDVFAGHGAPGLGGGVNEAVAQANGIDQAAANDVYETCLFPTSSDAMNDVQLDGNPAHTHWSGAYVR